MTSNSQLADWIEGALKHPQVVEDFYPCFRYPCADDYARRQKRVAMNSGDLREIEKWASIPVPPRKHGFDEYVYAVAADVLGHALIGKFNGDIEQAWWMYQGFRVSRLSSVASGAMPENYGHNREWAKLLDISTEFAGLLRTRHSEGYPRSIPIAQIVKDLRANAL